MAAKAKKSTRTVRKVASKSKNSVSIDMVKQAVVALGDRNGSTIKSILNYLVKTNKVSASSRTLVILAIGRGVRNGDLARKLPNTFAVGDGKRKASPMKKRKRKTKRTKKTVKSGGKRRRRRAQRKRKSIKKRSRKVSKKSRRNRRKGQTKRKARRSKAKAKKTTAKPAAVSTYNSRRPVRKSARGKNYRM